MVPFRAGLRRHRCAALRQRGAKEGLEPVLRRKAGCPVLGWWDDRKAEMLVLMIQIRGLGGSRDGLYSVKQRCTRPTLGCCIRHMKKILGARCGHRREGARSRDSVAARTGLIVWGRVYPVDTHVYLR